MTTICHRRPGADSARQVQDLIHDQGWVVEHLDRRTPVTSTLGLCRRGHPEFVVLGCDALEGFRLLEPLALAVEDGLQFHGSTDLTRFYPGPEQIILVHLLTTAPYLPTANKLFRREGTAPIPAFVLLRTDPLWEPSNVNSPPRVEATFDFRTPLPQPVLPTGDA
ncbi:hypothetical protein [Kribbella sp. NPDC051770]|uniref:hypothetical protein n=1 Tax=Kribbella sp. NPDC051770 TaxID=3155413 RepID=UPI0034302535